MNTATTALTSAGNFVQNNIIQPITTAATNAATWAQNNIVQPITTAVQQTVTWAQNNIVQPITTVAQQTATWTRNNIIEPAKQVWNDYVYEPMIQPITTTVKNILDTIQENIETKILASDIPLVVVIVTAVVVVGGLYFESIRRHRTGGMCLPHSTLANCFNDAGRIDFYEKSAISKDEFDDFLEAVREDIDSYERSPGDWGRMEYDTPFYDGNPSIIKFPWTQLNEDRVVCIEGIACNQQSAINYVAQGMYSAASGETLEEALKRADKWNSDMYDHPASPEELYWMTYGYNYYNEKNP